jgi:hypothetical protein
LARMSKFMGVEYDIDKGFSNETHPALIHAPTRIKQLETRAADLEWEGQCALSLRREIKTLREYLETSRSEYYPLH